MTTSHDDVRQAIVDALLARIADLESERDIYREMAQLALQRCHHLTNIVRAQRYCLQQCAWDTWAEFVVDADKEIEKQVRREAAA